ncbi:uncharacterized protein LOC119109526 [Pollicipes pollicipes]|uniref:uncharacterized protein LOC119109526 n=1 Tax=Pollicipes pollicipes TaxID=41117 RepID=UPI0018857F98|nr:uncharacterized protein LOC119109526 [Pollicipes pollicipes]
MERTAAAAALLALAAAAAARQAPVLQVRLSHVTHDRAEVQIVKRNSTADQVVVTLSRLDNHTDFQQLKTQLDPGVQNELKRLTFGPLSRGAKYRICSSARNNGTIVGGSKCFPIRTFEDRFLITGVITGAVTAGVVVLLAGALYALYRAVYGRRTSKTMVVNDTGKRANGVDNPAATLP